MPTLIPIIGATYSSGTREHTGVSEYRLCESGKFVVLDFGRVKITCTPESWLALAEREGHRLLSDDLVITVCPTCLTFYVAQHHCTPLPFQSGAFTGLLN